jgi:hypothetical protein
VGAKSAGNKTPANPLFENKETHMQAVSEEAVTEAGVTVEVATRESGDQELVTQDAVTPVVEAQFTSTQNHKLSLEDVRERIATDDKGKWDLVLAREEVLMKDGRLIFPDCKVYECETGLHPSPWATGQMCSRLNIPAAYFKRCPGHLRDAQFNYWVDRRRIDLASAHNAGALADEDPWDGIGNSNGSSANGHPGDSEPAEYRNGSSHRHANGGASSDTISPLPAQWPRGLTNGHHFAGGIYAGAMSSEYVKPEYWLLRARGDSLRAVLSDRYTPLDNRTLADCLHRTLPSHLQVEWLALDDEAFHLRIIDPTLGRDVLPDDRILAGLHIANSEVGKRSVTVDAMVYRLVCSNGLIKLVKGKSLLCQRHVSASTPHFIALLRQALGMALSTANGFLEQLALSTKLPIPDVESEIKRLGEQAHLSDSFLGQVKASLQQERSDQQETVFGLTNALTAAAQSLDAEKRYEMEVLAGRLLERKSLHSLSSNDKSSTRSAIEAAKELFGGKVVEL